jgi:predicted MFS family arabinose efflux permease
VVVFSCYAASYMRMPVVPLYARSLGLDAAEIGTIASAFYLVAAALSIPLGLLSDRLGKRRMALVGMAAIGVTSFLLYGSTTYVGLVGSSLMLGFGIAAFGPTVMSLVADLSPPTHLGRSYGWYTASVYVGMSLGPAFGGALGQALGLRPVFLTAGILSAAAWLVGWRFMPRGEAHGAARKPAARVIRSLARNRRLLACWSATAGACFGLGMFVTFFPLLAQEKGLAVGSIGLAFFAQGGVSAASRIPLGRWSDRVGDRRVFVLLGLGTVGAALAGMSFASGAAAFLSLAGLVGLGMGLTFTSMGALIAESVAPTERGLAMGGYNTCVFLGMMASAVSMGPLIHTAGYSPAFLASAGVNGLAGGLFLLLTRRRDGKVTAC